MWPRRITQHKTFHTHIHLNSLCTPTPGLFTGIFASCQNVWIAVLLAAIFFCKVGQAVAIETARKPSTFCCAVEALCFRVPACTADRYRCAQIVKKVPVSLRKLMRAQNEHVHTHTHTHRFFHTHTRSRRHVYTESTNAQKEALVDSEWEDSC